MQEALFYEKLNNQRTQCHLCPHNCVIAPDKAGICGVRKNIKGELYSLIYNLISSVNIDPVEKKPLYHFYPGSNILSIGTLGCNFHCGFCQNWSISQTSQETDFENYRKLTSSQIVELALKYKPQGNIGIAYTYNEPFIWYEYVLETAQKTKEAGLVNVLVTNGFASEAPLKELLPLIDAMNIDVKSINPDFYRKFCKGTLEPVLRTVEIAHKFCLVEITNLIIPTLNDSLEDFEKLTNWIASLDPNIPLHFSSYSPCYKFDIPPTPLATLKQAYAIAKKKLNYVYLGNILDNTQNNTYCSNCNKAVIQRDGFIVSKLDLTSENKCFKCGTNIKVVR